MGRIKNKKAGMEISIVLLVIATLILTTFSLYTFYTKQKLIREKIYTTKFLEDIYSKEEIINFYINEIMENASQSSKDETEFINNFKIRLEDYKAVMPELNQIEEQINEDNINYDKDNKIVTAEFQITIEDKVVENEKKIFSAVYTYDKKFEKELV